MRFVLLLLFLISGCVNSQITAPPPEMDLSKVLLSPPPMMIDWRFQELLKASPLSLSRISPALCQPGHPIHWNWLSWTWQSVLRETSDEVQTRSVYAQIRGCSPNSNVGQLVGALELLQSLRLPRDSAFANEILSWMRENWRHAPDFLDPVLLAVAETLKNLREKEGLSQAVSVAQLSLSWVPRSRITQLSTEALASWSMQVANLLPNSELDPPFFDRFSDIVMRALDSGHVVWAMDMARQLCRMGIGNPTANHKCRANLLKIREECFARPEIALEADYDLFIRFEHNNAAEVRQQILDLVASANLWNADLVPLIHLQGAHLLVKTHDLPGANNEWRAYLKDPLKSASPGVLKSVEDLKKQLIAELM